MVMLSRKAMMGTSESTMPSLYIPGPISTTPELGAELLLNGDFAAWTGDNPDSWFVMGEVDSDPMVTQVAPDGTAGIGAVRFYSSQTDSQPRISQNRVTAGMWVRLELDMSAYVSGAIRPEFSGSSQAPLGYGASGVKVHSGVARALFGFGPQVHATGPAPIDFVVNNISVKPLTLSTLYSIQSDAFVPAIIRGKVTKLPTYPAGFIHWADADNFVLLHIDNRGYLALEKCVNGTYTVVSSTPITYFEGALLELHYDATNKTYAAYYNDSVTPKIAAASVPDEVFTTAMGAGVFSTHADNIVVDFEAHPFLSGGGFPANSTNIFYMATDLQLGSPTFPNAATYAPAFVAAVNDAAPTAVLLGGDLIEWAADIAQAGDIVDSIAVPCYAAIGNHELRNAPDPAVAKALAVSKYRMSGSYYAFDCGICRVIVLDTNYDATDNDASIYKAHLPATQLAWLADELATATKDAVLIIMHHPPQEYRPGGIIENFDATDLAELSALVNDRENLWIFAGHWHVTHNFHLGGTPVYVRGAWGLGNYSIITVKKLTDGRITVAFGEKSVA